jgi:Fe-S-cluster containining protein
MKKIALNEPCPCGSGKKYKSCCGSSPTITEQELIRNQLITNRAVAYKGQIGIQRKNSCIDYLPKKKKILKELLIRQNEIALSKSETISCRKGCNYCCMLLVGATIQEVELIVYYLYQNEDLFNYFIEAYPPWILKVREVYDLLTKNQQTNDQFIDDKPTKGEPQYDEPNNRLLFAKKKLYCPFFRDGLCSIYEIRPFHCAGYFATTPSEWCNPLHPDFHKRRSYQTFERIPCQYLPFYNRSLAEPFLSFMPVMVYETLKLGTEALYKMNVLKTT